MKVILLSISLMLLTSLCYSQNKTIADENMRMAKLKCDAVPMDFFGVRNFKAHLQWNGERSFINCEIENEIDLFHFYDTLNCIPHLYDLTYDIVVDGKKIWDFRVDCDRLFQCELWTSEYWEGKFRAYKYLLDGQFAISYAAAIKKGVKSGIPTNECVAELHYDMNGSIGSIHSYYWLVQSNKDSERKKALRIHTISGEIEELTLMEINIKQISTLHNKK